MKALLILVLLAFFLLVFLSLGQKQIPASFFHSPEIYSPSDWIKESQIKVYPDRVIIKIDRPAWASFTDTNSMDHFLDEYSNAIEIQPSSPEQIRPGDIISYQTKYGIIIHRVIETGKDQQGAYYLVKGDNNSFPDPFKVRFEDVKGVLVAIIY